MAHGDFILPYPAQLPQDYYNRNLPPPPVAAAPAAAPPVAAPPPPPPSPPDTSANLGGAHYGVYPPSNPLYGWLWSDGRGFLYMYQEPGIWIQVGTNW